ncbi:Gfo/Idh/MocA family oxidoreductase [Paenibacillus qinlingensis]|uniref:Dehydrogenase n=1 Tax=Paenibacillus qinlingensis TaxID=1837343 RepID=A0ABU1NSM4_9BACL|nr:Gfo/Idh/MocA family oxidoreductase [Paenibacillus qinlingensis]MDR6550482.1 putative dehydrogenase [Paenibacillus qinlingensis]
MYHAAIIGLGKIGLTFDIPYKGRVNSHAMAYHLHPEVALVATVGRRQEQAEQLAMIAPEAQFYGDHELSSMLRDHHLDIISICTPPAVRYDLLQTVLEQSKARVIFLEKPVANELEEAERIAALCKLHSERTVVVNLSRRWSEGAMQVRRAVQNETYGKLKKIHVRYSRGISNTGSHLFDMVRYVAGSIEQVKVVERVSTNLDEREDWTYSFLFTAANNGVTGYAEGFDDRNYNLFELVLYLEGGMIEMVQGGTEIRYYGTEPHPLQAGMRQLVFERAEKDDLGKASPMVNAVAHLVHILDEGLEPLCTLADGIYPLYVAEALNQSYARGGTTEQVLVE